MRESFQITFRKTFLLLPIFAISLLSFSDVRHTAGGLLQESFTINRQIKTIRLTMLMKEKVNEDYIFKKADFKIAYNPFQLYLKQGYPNEGLEILYNEGENEGKAIVNRNALAFSVLHLDPTGNIIRRNHHHSIFKAGISYMLEVFEHLYTKYEPASENVWKYEGLVKYADIICHKITFKSPDFKFIPYLIQEGETLEEISRKYYISDYMIYEKNPSIKSFESLKPGMNISIPTDYGKKIILYIHKQNLLPVGVKIFDEEGLYEEYTYLNVQVNPQYSPLDFDVNNPSYGFN
jgi:hypothetical protein